MTDNSRAKTAEGYFRSGYNCAQAVAMAFSDLMNMNESEVAKLTIGFGGGMGRMREVCGAVSGLVFVMGALYGDAGKQEIYSEIQKLAGQFRDKNGSIVCRELLGLSIKGTDSPVPEERTQQYYKKRPCAELVAMSAQILDDYIKENPTG